MIKFVVMCGDCKYTTVFKESQIENGWFLKCQQSPCNGDLQIVFKYTTEEPKVAQIPVDVRDLNPISPTVAPPLPYEPSTCNATSYHVAVAAKTPGTELADLTSHQGIYKTRSGKVVNGIPAGGVRGVLLSLNKNRPIFRILNMVEGSSKFSDYLIKMDLAVTIDEKEMASLYSDAQGKLTLDHCPESMGWEKVNG